MTLAPGKTLSNYEILGPLGSGGMGEVYRARDTRLDREVAIKVLPEELAGDPDRLKRFEREARVLASLNHPNIAQVYGIGEDDETSFMAMELVPGEDLANRISRGVLPVDEATEICCQIAAGLEAAHEAGIIHRDLKPANVRITPEGSVKILDFGLAKPVRPKAAGSGMTTAEEDSFLLTEEGLILGTPTYMSPEQARGKPVDRRTDLWAFGCVLYECLTGERPFQRGSMTDMFAAIVSEDPDWSRLPDLPARVVELLKRALTKDSGLRLRDAGEARVQFALAANEPAAETVAETVAWARPWRGLALAAAVVTAVLVFWIGTRFGGSNGSSTTAGSDFERLAVCAVVHEFQEGQAPGRLKISPDGKRIAWTEADGLHVRDLMDPDPRTILSKERKRWHQLDWSPNSRELAYLDDEAIWRIDVESRATARIADFDGIPWTPLEWTEDDHIVYYDREGIAAVRLDGERELWIELEDDIDHLDWFLLVPGRRAVLALPHGARSFELFYRGERRAVPGLSGAPAFLTKDGTLLLHQGSQGPLTAVSFSLDALKVRGEPRVVLEESPASVSVADNGTLAYEVMEGNPGRELVTIARGDGSVTVIGRSHPNITGGAFSPDGNQVAFCVVDGFKQVSETWVHDFERDLSTPLIQRDDGLAGVSFLDDRRIAVSPLFPVRGTFVYPATGKGTPEHLEGATLGQSRGDGSRVFIEDVRALFGEFGELVPTYIVHPEEEPRVLFDGGQKETFHTFSRDGQWMLHSSERTGSRQLYLTRFPLTEEEWSVTADGGENAWFAADNSEILFQHQNSLYRVTFETEPEVRLGVPELLFEVTPDTALTDYDGEGRFLASRNAVSGRRLVYVDTQGL